MKKIMIIAALLLMASCTDSSRAKIGGYGSEFLVEIVNCDGSVTKSWTSTGKVHSVKDSDGYYFMDKASGKLIEVSGNLIITKQ